MATNELYKDETPKPTQPGWVSVGSSGVGGGSGGSGGIGGGVGGSGGGISSNKGQWNSQSKPPTLDDEENPWYTVGEWSNYGAFLMLVDGSGLILTHKSVILKSLNGCLFFEIECQIENDAEGRHVQCIMLELIMQDDPDVKSFVHGDLPCGGISVRARWQDGHYNYSDVYKVRFRLKNQPEKISPWYKLPFDVDSGKLVIVLTVEDGVVRVKHFT